MNRKDGMMYPHLVFRKPVLWEPFFWQKKSFLYFTIGLLARWNGIPSERSQKPPRVLGEEV
jgi:hypothetical protein